jgi:hypothetical protein
MPKSHLSMQAGERIASKAASANKEPLPQLD